MQTSCSSVEGHLVGSHEVDSLDNIDLAVVGPKRPLRPEGGPHGAAEWKVDDVGNPQSAIIVKSRGLNTDLADERSILEIHTTKCDTNCVTLLAGGDDSGVVYFHDSSSSIVDVCQVLLCSGRLIQPRNITCKSYRSKTLHLRVYYPTHLTSSCPSSRRSSIHQRSFVPRAL